MGLFESHVPLDSITIMVQKEVADRMQVGPGTKDYGALSLAVQYYAKPEIMLTVPASCFMPRPNVDSAVIRLTRYQEPPVCAQNEKFMFDIIRASFNQRRKTLVNGLSNAPGLRVSKEQVVEALEEMELSATIRGEALTLEQFADLSDILGKSKAIRENIHMAQRYSRVNSNVLIVGETGTGKELFAHSIHQASSRSDQPFVALNCAALPENLLESELFGYEAGAFSGAAKGGKIGLFELAHRGTIFLDEIGEIPITLQAKLLRVLQEKEIRRIGSTSVHPIDVRVVSATNINIEEKRRYERNTI